MNINVYGDLEARGLDRCFDYWAQQLGLEWRFSYGSIVTFLAEASVDQRSDDSAWDCIFIEPDELSKALMDLLSVLNSNRRLVFLLSPRRAGPRDEEMLLRAREDLQAANVTLDILDGRDTAELYNCSAIHRSGSGDTPYSAEFFAAIATATVRRIAVVEGVAGPPIKLIAVDADHTLWSGACGEDEIANLALGDAHLTLQRFLLDQQKRGVLLALCSHAARADLEAAFTTLPMLIRVDDFLIIAGEGRAKSASLASIAAELAIAHSAILMIDDNPAQCHEISSALPGVTTLLFEANAALKLNHIWRLDPVARTQEDERRNQFYIEQRERKVHLKHFAERSDFFSSIDQKVTVRAASKAALPRVEQLSRRCNQFHNDGRRWPLVSIKRYLDGGGHCLVVELSDRFGDLGIVAAMLFVVKVDRIDVDLIAMSCRALDRDVEACVLGHLIGSYGSIGLHFKGGATGRNEAFLRFAASVAKGAAPSDLPSLSQIAKTLSATAYGWTRRTDHKDPTASPVAALATCQPDVGLAGRIFDIEAVTHNHSASLILSAMRSARSAVSSNSSLPATIRDAMATILRHDRLGLDDSFFDVGGDSLMAVDVLTELEQLFGVMIPLTILFDTAFTPNDIATEIQCILTTMPPVAQMS
uniref:FkbH like protein n=1 Tax=Rhodopseudomonas palustris (strain DX-1) TaxID=652103 RepID=E6VQ47_RHOPX